MGTAARGCSHICRSPRRSKQATPRCRFICYRLPHQTTPLQSLSFPSRSTGYQARWEEQHPEPYQPSLPAQQELPLPPAPGGTAAPKPPPGLGEAQGLESTACGTGRCLGVQLETAAGRALPSPGSTHTELQRCPCHRQKLGIAEHPAELLRQPLGTRYQTRGTLHNCMPSMCLTGKENIFPFFQVCCKTTYLTHLSRKSRALGSTPQHGCLLAPRCSSAERPGVSDGLHLLFLLRIPRKQIRLPRRKEAGTSSAMHPPHPAARHSTASQPEAANKPPGAGGGCRQTPACQHQAHLQLERRGRLLSQAVHMMAPAFLPGSLLSPYHALKHSVAPPRSKASPPLFRVSCSAQAKRPQH